MYFGREKPAELQVDKVWRSTLQPHAGRRCVSPGTCFVHRSSRNSSQAMATTSEYQRIPSDVASRESVTAHPGAIATTPSRLNIGEVAVWHIGRWESYLCSSLRNVRKIGRAHV